MKKAFTVVESLVVVVVIALLAAIIVPCIIRVAKQKSHGVVEGQLVRGVLTIEHPDGYQHSDIVFVTIDGCEYLIHLKGNGSSLIHKANCDNLFHLKEVK